MPSVRSNGNPSPGRVESSGTGVPTLSGDWTVGFWFKIYSYANQYTQVIGFSGVNNLGADTGESGDTTKLEGYVYDGSPLYDTILASSYTGWCFLAIKHDDANANDYIFLFRKEGESSLSQFTLTKGLTLSEIHLLGDAFGSPANTAMRSFWAKSSTLSDADILTASTSLSAPSGTNLTFLALDDHTVAGDNLGTGADWTITGTLTTESSDEPNPAIGGGSAPPSIFASTRINQNTLLRL